MDTASQTLTLAATVGHINLSDRDDTGKQLARVLLAQQIEREEDSTCFDISKHKTTLCMKKSNCAWMLPVSRGRGGREASH